jgi:hypothetical protein
MLARTWNDGTQAALLGEHMRISGEVYPRVGLLAQGGRPPDRLVEVRLAGCGMRRFFGSTMAIEKA